MILHGAPIGPRFKAPLSSVVLVFPFPSPGISSFGDYILAAGQRSPACSETQIWEFTTLQVQQTAIFIRDMPELHNFLLLLSLP